MLHKIVVVLCFLLVRGLATLGLAGMLATACTQPRAPGPQADGTSVTPQGWLVAPAGHQTDIGAGPLSVAVSPRADLVLVAHAGLNGHALMALDAAGNLLQRIAASDGRRKGLFSDAQGHASGYYAGLAFAPDGGKAYAADGPGNALHVFAIDAARSLAEGPEIPLPPLTSGSETYPAGIAVSADGNLLFVAANLADALYVVSPAERQVIARIPVGHRPYGVALNRAGTLAFVSDWGARTVSVISVTQNKVVGTVETGTHPSAIVANPVVDEIYVANSDSDSVSVLSGATGQVLRGIDLRPYPGAAIGASPNALVVSPDGRTLYVANGLDNDVAVLNLAAGDRVAGLIPTGWYPSGLATDPRGEFLFVTNMKGRGVGPAPGDAYWPDLIHGTLSRTPVPDAAGLAHYTAQVVENDRFYRPAPIAGNVIQGPPGGRSPIRHVIYVLKENRTYDQILGDLGRGNGDPTLTLFGEAITPNHHRLARSFVTLDNFYVDAEVSVDGWSWSNGGYANSYIQKNWPLDYGNYNRPDDLGGYGNAETAGLPGEKPGDSFLWDALLKANIPYVNFGFFVNNPPVVDASMHGLLGHTDPLYPGWDLATTDQTRIDRWLQVFAGYAQSGEMPAAQFIALPSDHTSATAIGKRTPRAYVADNDLALGRLVEAVSHSRFWADTAIFVVEDDAQDGPDHVDAHRTVALVISPYTQTGKVDSSFYSTVSMLRTMELILGVPPMSQFDSAAQPMSASFSDTPNLRPYAAIVPNVPLDEINGPNAPMARQSAALDFTLPDRIPMGLMNEIVWKSVRGADSKLPAIVHSSLVRPHDDDGDGD